jgi:hypothetical protein
MGIKWGHEENKIYNTKCLMHVTADQGRMLVRILIAICHVIYISDRSNY